MPRSGLHPKNDQRPILRSTQSLSGLGFLLLAPESGEELRAQLRERGQNFLGEIRHAADARRIELKDRLDTLREPRA